MLNPCLHNITFSNFEYKLYAKHLILPQVEIEGQKRLTQAKVLCVGAGGLSSACLIYLATAGVGNIGIIDNDIVEHSNLQRQIIYHETNIGQKKVECAKNNIQKINSRCKIDIYHDFLSMDNAMTIIPLYDLIIDTTDNFTAKYIISNACSTFNKPHIFGAILKFEGQVTVFNYQGGPHYKDLYPHEVLGNTFAQCSEGGILGVLPGVIGTLQATEVIKIITGINNILSESLIIYDALNTSFRKVRLRKRNSTGSFNKQIKSLLENFYIRNSNQTLNKIGSKLDTNSLTEIQNTIFASQSKVLLIDVRNTYEYYLNHLDNTINIPLKKLKNKTILSFLKNESYKKTIYVYCNKSSRSMAALSILRRNKIASYKLDSQIIK